MIGGTTRSHYYQDGRIYDVPEGVEQAEPPAAEGSASQPLPLPSQAVHSPSSSCSTVSAAVQPQTEQQETSTAKKKKKKVPPAPPPRTVVLPPPSPPSSKRVEIVEPVRRSGPCKIPPPPKM